MTSIQNPCPKNAKKPKRRHKFWNAFHKSENFAKLKPVFQEGFLTCLFNKYVLFCSQSVMNDIQLYVSCALGVNTSTTHYYIV